MRQIPCIRVEDNQKRITNEDLSDDDSKLLLRTQPKILRSGYLSKNGKQKTVTLKQRVGNCPQVCCQQRHKMYVNTTNHTQHMKIMRKSLKDWP